MSNIVVLAGGTSTERDVSLVSGRDVYKALKSVGHNCVLLDVFIGLPDEDEDTLDKLFTDKRDWAEKIISVGEINPDISMVKKNRPNSIDGYFGPNVIRLCQKADIVFMALHGEHGENGRVQAAFDLLGIKYTGTNYQSSALAMDKLLTKAIFKAKAVPTPDYFILKKDDKIIYPNKYPVVVKVACGGSSVGVYIPQNQAEYEVAVLDGFKYENELLVEEYVKGREFTVGVVDGEAYPVLEIAPVSGFYDYKNKYQAGSTVETCPANIPEDITEKMQKIAEDAYSALSMESYARMDFMMDEKGNCYCLEANTLPGMTPTSLLPQEAAARGESYTDLCEKLVKVSLAKYED